jgi:hypothetical protein
MRNYWSRLVIEIQAITGQTDADLADELGVSEEMIVGWTDQNITPSTIDQEALEAIAARVGLSSLSGICTVVRESPFQMLLVDTSDLVITASESSGFVSGLTCEEQTPENQLKAYQAFSVALNSSGFWDAPGKRFTYAFPDHGHGAEAIVVSVSLWGTIYGVVQMKPQTN